MPLHPKELQESYHRIVRFGWSNNVPYAMHRDGKSVKLDGRYMLAVDDGNSYPTAGLAGLGTLWLPDYMAREYESKGTLERMFKDWESTQCRCTWPILPTAI